MYPEIFDSRLEKLSLKRLSEEVERPLLLKQLEYVFKKSPFYKKKLQTFKSAKEAFNHFKLLPFTEKKEIIDDQIEFPPLGSNLSVDRKKVIRIHRTSGTTGRPVFIAMTGNDIEATIRSGARCFWASGLRPDDVVFHCLNYCMWIGGYTDHQSLEKTGASVIPYGVGNSKNLIESIIEVKPTALSCTVSYLKKLELLLENDFNMEPANLSLTKGLFGGEGGLQDRQIRKKIEDTWGIKAMDANYGVSDVLSMFGGECSEQKGLHFMGQGNLYIELIDPDSGEVFPIEKGVTGEFVLTNLQREAQPVIRFRTHDMVEILDHNRCDCGRSSFRFKVLGRSDDMIVVKGLNIYPVAIGGVVSEFLDAMTGEYQIIVENKQPVDKITVAIEYRDGLSENERGRLNLAIAKRIKERFEVNSQIELVPAGALPRTEGKTKRLVRIEHTL
ncbi:MAG: hypothetical protein PHU49_00140 [Syntrophorhabdaceae bacterium]|nr:hypothetical protein [Syntrophorhabdaceae bacterium]